ncbi:hypothetical protein GCM10027082_24230 [Comamonas humi]
MTAFKEKISELESAEFKVVKGPNYTSAHVDKVAAAKLGSRKSPSTSPEFSYSLTFMADSLVPTGTNKDMNFSMERVALGTYILNRSQVENLVKVLQNYLETPEQ